MITVSHITKKFGQIVAVHDVSFSLAEGTITGLLGPNGAGKTTIMRMLTGYYTPDEGTVTVNGLSFEDDPVEARAQIGYLPESNPLYKDMLVSKYLRNVARQKRVPRSAYRDTFERIVADTGIGEVFYRPIAELSKGYRQRVGMAAALIGDPRILILDEPTEGLDPNQRGDMRELLLRLGAERTLLVSTHVLSEVQAIADHLIVLNRGELVAEGTLADLTRAQQGVRFSVDIEGSGAHAVLRSLASVADIQVIKDSDRMLSLIVLASDADAFPRELSKLISARNYVLWRLVQESAGLERMFSDLTRIEERL